MRGTVAKALRKQAIGSVYSKIPSDKIPNPDKVQAEIEKEYQARKKAYKKLRSNPNAKVKAPNRRQVRLAMRVADALLAPKK